MTDAVEMFCAACGKSFWIDREIYDEIAKKIGSSWEMDCPLCRKMPTKHPIAFTEEIFVGCP